jgi:hypothetical protein
VIVFLAESILRALGIDTAAELLRSLVDTL